MFKSSPSRFLRQITELYVISETANQECLLSEQKLTSLKYDLRIAAKTRDFYDERQIKTAEINKSLQNELTQVIVVVVVVVVVAVVVEMVEVLVVIVVVVIVVVVLILFILLL